MLPDLAAIALTALAAWALIKKGQSVMRVLGACALVGLLRHAVGW
jgi:chromate transporter